MTDPRDPHCRYPKCECPPGYCQRLTTIRIDTDSDFTIDIGRDKAALDRSAAIAELGRRHPAAADDVDAILAMPPFGYLIEKSGINNGYYFVSLAEYAHVEERFQHIYLPVFAGSYPDRKA